MLGYTSVDYFDTNRPGNVRCMTLLPQPGSRWQAYEDKEADVLLVIPGQFFTFVFES